MPHESGAQDMGAPPGPAKALKGEIADRFPNSCVAYDCCGIDTGPARVNRNDRPEPDLHTKQAICQIMELLESPSERHGGVIDFRHPPEFLR